MIQRWLLIVFFWGGGSFLGALSMLAIKDFVFQEGYLNFYWSLIINGILFALFDVCRIVFQEGGG